MEKINTITVNGVTYEIGGTGGSGNIGTYELPSAILSLTEDSTKEEITAAFGGDEGIAAIKSAIDNKCLFFIYEKSSTYNKVINVDAAYMAYGVIIRYSYRNIEASPDASTLMDVIINASLIGQYVTKKQRYGYRLNKGLRNINSESSSSDIQSALGIEPTKLAKMLKGPSITSYYIDSGAGKIPVTIEVDESTEGELMFAITAIGYGVFGSQSPCSTLLITYNIESGVYSASVISAMVMS